MRFVWDEVKQASNLDKHGLDFAAFETGFDFQTAVALPARDSSVGRRRSKLIGVFERRLVVAAIVTPLGSEGISLVSLRRASRAERRIYEQRYGP